MDALIREFIDSALAEIDLAVRFIGLAKLDTERAAIHIKAAEDACAESRRWLEIIQLPLLPAETVRQRLTGLRAKAKA